MSGRREVEEGERGLQTEGEYREREIGKLTQRHGSEVESEMKAPRLGIYPYHIMPILPSSSRVSPATGKSSRSVRSLADPSPKSSQGHVRIRHRRFDLAQSTPAPQHPGGKQQHNNQEARTSEMNDI